ncbi:Uncharacterized protein FWK35_00001963, partial [Aphis craccivora]
SRSPIGLYTTAIGRLESVGRLGTCYSVLSAAPQFAVVIASRILPVPSHCSSVFFAAATVPKSAHEIAKSAIYEASYIDHGKRCTISVQLVVQIQEKTSITDWAHVDTKDNPADIISRGCCPSKLTYTPLWWHGPDWLVKDEKYWPQSDKNENILNIEIPEVRSVTLATFDVIPQYPSLINRLRKNSKLDDVLSVDEINRARTSVIKCIQKEAFPQEIRDLVNLNKTAVSSKLYRLCPFLDEDNIIRVVRRLKNASSLDVYQRHPIILPADCHVTLRDYYSSANMSDVCTVVRRRHCVPYARNTGRPLNFYRRFIPNAAEVQETRWSAPVVRHYARLFQHLLPSDRRHRATRSPTAIRASTSQHGRVEHRGGSRARAKVPRPVATARFLFQKTVTRRTTVQHVRRRAPCRVPRHTTLRTDHRPLTFAFSLKTETIIDRRQFFHDVEYVHGKDNVVPDALSRLEIAETTELGTGLGDLRQWSLDQTAGPQLQHMIADGNARLYRRRVFNVLHGQAHRGSRATLRLIKSRYCWTGTNRDIAQWTKCCEPCQRAKVNKHTSTAVAPFAPPERRFGHIHVDLVGPLPPSNGFKYLLTVVGRYTRWPEAWPIENMSAHAVAQLLTTNWIACFGVPDTIATDQGRQFESDLFRALFVVKSSPYHPQSNGMVERFHRTLKSALIAHESKDWSSKLPIVLLAPRNTIKAGLEHTPAKLEYGTTLRLHLNRPPPRPGGIATQINESTTLYTWNDPRRTTCYIRARRPRPSKPRLHIDAVRPPLQPHYEEPFAVLGRREKTFKVQRDNSQQPGFPSTVSSQHSSHEKTR